MENTPDDHSGQYAPAPWAKWLVIGGLVAAIVGLEIYTYRLGVSHGFAEGSNKPSSNAIAASDNKAVDHLKHFMQSAASDTESLSQLVRNRKQELAWIKDPEVLTEVEWTLGLSLLQREQIAAGRELFQELFDRTGDKPTALWTHRMESVARAESALGDPAQALRWWKKAQENYAGLGMTREEIRCLEKQVELLSGQNNPQALETALKTLSDRALTLGESGRLLQANTLVQLGRLLRTQGNKNDSNQYFEKALGLWKGEQGLQLGSAQICFGEALMDAGREEEAEKLLIKGVDSLNATPADAGYMMSGLRTLAQLAVKKGDYNAALAYLYRADGAAHGRLPDNDPYWTCLYDQRGWVHLLQNEPELAARDFFKAIKLQTEPTALAQAYEGMGRSCILLGKGEQAHKALTQAYSLRKQHLPTDIAGLARVARSLGQACDINGNTDESTRTYGEALGYFDRLGEAAPQEDLALTLMSLAYACQERKQWQEAKTYWERLIAMTPETDERRQDMQSRLQDCNRALGVANISPASADKATVKPRSTRTSRRR